MLPSSTRRISRNYEDRFNVTLPENVYLKYNAIRKSYLIEAIANLDKCMAEDGIMEDDKIGIKEQGEDML